MKVMSFNILCKGADENYYENRKDLVVKTILDCKPDALGVQEATPAWMEILSDKLTGYEYAGVGRDDGKRAGEYSAIFYLKDKFEKEYENTFWLSETPDTPSKGWDARCTRICTVAKLKDKATGEQFVFANTHLDHKGAVAKESGTRLICSRIEDFGNLPFIVTGDFNSWPDSLPYKIMIRNGFSDSRDIAEQTDDMYTFHIFEKPLDNTNSTDYHKIIDYIFVKNVSNVKSFETLNIKIDGRYPSDHFPIISEITF